MDKKSFLTKYGRGRTALAEYIKNQEQLGNTEQDIQVNLLSDGMSKSPQMVYKDYKFYHRIKDEIKWQK